MRSLKVFICFWLLIMSPLLTAPVFAKVYLNKEDALKLAFPKAESIERKTLFLTDTDVKEIERLSGKPLESKIFTYYTGIGKEGISGYAFLGSHIVRTKPAVYMIVIDPTGRLQSVEILAFYEPEEHLPSRRWFEQFQGKVLDDSLWPRRGIIALSGATLSVNIVTAEVRKILSIFKIMIMKKGDM